jgi:hypothetical protein
VPKSETRSHWSSLAGRVTPRSKSKVTIDEMSGFNYAVAKSFKVKPVLELFKAKGTVTARAGKSTSTLPDTGRAEPLAKFAKGCTLD